MASVSRLCREGLRRARPEGRVVLGVLLEPLTFVRTAFQSGQLLGPPVFIMGHS